MKLSEFDYILPKELIAQYPLRERDSSRLLVLKREDKAIKHCSFKDIAGYLRRGDLLVLNDTKVLSARIRAKRVSGGKVEILLLSRKSADIFSALIKPGRLKIGEKINFGGKDIYGVIKAKNEVAIAPEDVEAVYNLGSMPLPPYIKREPEDSDSTRYQTVYAAKDGAIAAPTAGLHFTRELLEKIDADGVGTAYITLHVGHATFKPVKSGDIREHRMDKEFFQIDKEAEAKIKAARKDGNRIFAVGTTSCRALESYASGVKDGYTDLFIYPGYKFRLTDCLLTNFHLPRTTLFMLVCAFAGEELAKKAYQEAISQKYRFYSYGDAMLII